jgi:hypothetical protein
MAAAAQRLRLRLVLEGIEVPIIAATIQTVPNAPAAASIQIPPLPEGTRLFPRTVVHLFFLDVYDAGSPYVRKGAASSDGAPSSPTTYEQGLPDLPGGASDTADRTKYKLLFGGEVVGFQWTKNATNRSLVLQCLDWSNYWNYAFQWNNTDLFGPGVKALFSGGSTNLFTDFLSDEGSAIMRILQTPSVQYPRLKGLLGGIVHLLEAIGGSYYYGKKFAGQNLFFSLAELRLHITQTITACETDPTASRLLNAGGYDGLFGRVLGGLGQQVSIRDAINALMGIIFHETYAIPTPYYVSPSGGDVTGRTRQSARSDPRTAFVAQRADDLVASLERMKSALAESDAAGDGAGALALKKDLDLARRACADVLNRIRDASIAPTRAFYASALAALDRARASGRRWQPTGAANPSATSAPIAAALDEAIAALRRAADFVVTTAGGKTTPARLCQQIFRPDVWFSAPPRCNVLFPEHYGSLSYTRQFLEEPTRLLLKTNDEFFGEDELFDQYYFAPKGTTLKAGRNDLASILSNDLLEHELFTGIVPVFEKMGELNILAARSGTVGARMPKIGLAQRSTNFLYFKYRYGARHMQVSGRFNPYVAPGFPGLVLDKYMDLEAAQRRADLVAQFGGTNADAAALAGTHFLANFTEVTHSVDQSQGRTDINCSYPRQPEESIEFLGVTGGDKTVRRRSPTDALRSTDVAALNPPRPLTEGPNQGSILRVTDVTAVYKAKDLASGPNLPLFAGPRRAGTSEPRIRVAVGITAPASAYGSEVAALVGDPSALVAFRAFRVEEEVPRYHREAVDLPAEEYIRPGWYGDVWHPSQIGQVYEQFFGTGAITDAQQIDSPDGGSTSPPAEGAADALADAGGATSATDPAAVAPAVLSLDKDASIAAAVGFLVQIYSHIRASGIDVEEFLRAYTWRPIATMVDMFGSSDLELSPDGSDVVQGVEGFHSRAFGPYDDLFGLVTPDIDNVLGIARGSTVAQKGDTRKRKQDAVRTYVTALQFARAYLG